MKKLSLFLALALLCAIPANAQKKIGSYTSNYLGKTYEISASEDENLILVIDVAGESSRTDINFYIKGETKIEEFVQALKELKEKYAEWRKVAIENNVKDFSKPFDITFPSITVAWYGTKWWFDFSERLKPRFMVTGKGDIIAVMAGEAQASSNEYIKEKYYFVLSEISEFDELLSQIEPTSLRAALEKIAAPADLFK